MTKLSIFVLSLLGFLSLAFISQAQNNHYIAFVSDRTGVENIYLVRSDGSNLINVSQSRYRDWNPAWSPDGQTIVFNSMRDENAEIYTISLNGLEATNISNSTSAEYSPAWSPDGSRIAFISDRDGGFDLYILDLSSNTVSRITEDGIGKDHPTWSPDSSAIAYWQSSSTGAEIRRIDVASRAVTVLVTEGNNGWPAWSPDGSRIAFHRFAADNSSEIWSVPANGGTESLLVNGAGNELRPAWSPDGAALTYVSDRDGNYELYIEQNGVARRLTTDASTELSPAWQPQAFEVEMGGGSAQQQNFSIISASAATGSQAAGEGEARLYAPSEVRESDLIVVRLEVQARNLINTDVIIPTSTPSLSTLPTPTALPLVDMAFAQVFTIMGAELRGVDLANFSIDPAPTDYVLRLDPNIVNYWEWYLRPITPQAFRTNFLSVALYVPEAQADGSISKTVLNRFNFEITVVQASAAEPSPEPTAIPAAPLFSLRKYSPNYFIISADSSTDFSSLRLTVSSTNFERLFREDWPEVIPDDFEQGVCFIYQDAEAEASPYPEDCQRFYVKSLNPRDIFWYDSAREAFRDVILRYAERSFSCHAADEVCPINPANLAPYGDLP